MCLVGTFTVLGISRPLSDRRRTIWPDASRDEHRESAEISSSMRVLEARYVDELVQQISLNIATTEVANQYDGRAFGATADKGVIAVQCHLVQESTAMLLVGSVHGDKTVEQAKGKGSKNPGQTFYV